MDEDLAIIAKNTRKEEIKNFFIKHKKKIYFLTSLILLAIFSTFFYLDNVKKFYRRSQKKETEPDDTDYTIPTPKTDRIVFVVPHINNIVKIYTPVEQMKFNIKNTVVMLR